jgi:hypothetical protein
MDFQYFSEARDRIGEKVGPKRFNFDLKDDRIIVSILLTGNGSGNPNSEFEIVDGLPEDEEFWWITDDEALEKKIKELNIQIPELPFENPHFTLGYNDPASDLVAYWYYEDIADEINISDIGNDYWFTADQNTFCGKDKLLTEEETALVYKILDQ